VELSTAWRIVGRPERAIKDAEQVVVACRTEVEEEYIDGQKCTLVHSLTTLSHSLAAVQRNDEALMFAKEAVSIYTQNMAQIWEDFVYTIRKQELGANAFHSLSLRLATSGEPAQALISAEKATDLYRELVALAPRHLPTLARSLQNLGSILWNVGRRDESIAACEEAVSIMRKVVDPETYFLPALAKTLDQLVGYLREKGDGDGASIAAAECAEVRRKFELLPPQPDFLFEKVEMGLDDEDDENVDEHANESECAADSDEDNEDTEEVWETASEADSDDEN
jgi:tetratricopeptide (TPR) repeat protein